MRIGMVGLGRMGANMAARLARGGHQVVAFDRSPDAVRAAVTAADAPAGQNVEGADSLEALVTKLGDGPRVAWVMVPAGDPTEQTVTALGALLQAGDVVVDGGNSNYQESIRRAQALRGRGVRFVDAGTSGGIWGLAEGYSLMVGGDDDAIAALRPALETLAPAADRGWGHVGPVGSGHFAKMIHNGIEYGMMQAMAEGFAILRHKEQMGDAPHAFDLAQVAEIWRHGSVVRSWLLDLAARALHEDGKLSSIAPVVADSGEGRWTVAEAIALDVPAPVITHSLIARLRSRDAEGFGDRMLAALRNQFGGHAITKAGAATGGTTP